MELHGADLLSIDALDRADIERILDVAERMEPFARGRRVTDALRGAVLVSLFFEPSTRTRLSFASAFQRLGGTVVDVVGAGNSSIVKGESLSDTGRVVSGYGDVIVMRHKDVGSVAALAAGATVPVINAGDGPGEHPTQALLDLYALRRERGGLDGLTVAMVGDLKHGRTTHSLARALARFDGVELVLVAPDALQLPDALVDDVIAKGVRVRKHDDVEALAGVDAAYMTRVQEERFATQADANLYRGRLKLDAATFARICRPGTTLLHPLPRDSRPGAQELATDLDALPELAIFRQADGGVQVRMALLALTLGAADAVEETARPPRWSRR